MFNTEQYFQNIAIQNGWGFAYGTNDRKNLFESALSEMGNVFNKNSNADIVLFARRQNSGEETTRIELILGYMHKLNHDKREINKDFVVPAEKLMRSIILPNLKSDGDVSNVTITDIINEFDSNISGVFTALNFEDYGIQDCH